MKIERIRKFVRGGRPYLELELDEGTVLLGTDYKSPLLERGLVYLGPEWEDAVPPIDLPSGLPGEPHPIRLFGFTRNPKVWLAYWKFLQEVAEGKSQNWEQR